MKTLQLIIFLEILINSFSIQSQTLQTLKTTVSEMDTINKLEDESFGEGDDGIYNILEPTVQSSSDFNENGITFNAQNIHDFNLYKPWIEGTKNYGIGEYVEFTFDLKESSIKEDSAFSINSFFIINGYRKSIQIWRNNSRVKKLKMYINNVPFAYILLADTYKFQTVKFNDYWIKYGNKTIIKFEIIEVYPGEKYKNTAISELEFSGKYSENMD